jgi:hypothetical protein
MPSLAADKRVSSSAYAIVDAVSTLARDIGFTLTLSTALKSKSL